MPSAAPAPIKRKAYLHSVPVDIIASLALPIPFDWTTVEVPSCATRPFCPGPRDGPEWNPDQIVREEQVRCRVPSLNGR